MNDSYGIGVEKGITKLTMTMVFNQREVNGISQSPTLVQRYPTDIIIANANGISSQASHESEDGKMHLVSVNMVIPEALEVVKEITLPHFYLELQVLRSKQPSRTPDFDNLEL